MLVIYTNATWTRSSQLNFYGAHFSGAFCYKKPFHFAMIIIIIIVVSWPKYSKEMYIDCRLVWPCNWVNIPFPCVLHRSSYCVSPKLQYAKYHTFTMQIERRNSWNSKHNGRLKRKQNVYAPHKKEREKKLTDVST